MKATHRGRFLQERQSKVLELLDTSGQRLHAVLARVTLSEQATGDLMQELFLRLSNAKGLDRARDPFAYAWRVALNLAFEWRRHRRKVRFEPLDEARLPADSGPSALDRMVRTEQLEKILDATAQLSELAR